MKIVLSGDNHLGKKQYNNLVREEDFHDAWRWVCNKVSEIGPDFFVMSGDLFDKKRIDDPITLSVATEGLCAAGGLCKVIAIEGNHDGRSFIHKGRSWLEYLREQGLIDVILRPGEIFRYFGATFCGSPWAGRGTIDAFEACAWDAEIAHPDDFLVGVFHAAPEGYVMGSGTIPPDKLLGSKFNLILMGHCHRPFNIGEKVLCAGSPEICDIGEINNKAGIWVIDFDPDTREKSFEFIEYKPRVFLKYELDSSDLISDGSSMIKINFGNRSALEPVVIIDIVGSRRAIDVAELARVAKIVFDPLLVRINDKMSARAKVKPLAAADLFGDLLEGLLEGKASNEEFNSLLDCFESDDRGGVIPVLMEAQNDN